MPITVRDLAKFTQANIEGGDPETVVDSAADISSAAQGQVTQLTNAKYADFIKDSSATACFVADGFAVDNFPGHVVRLVCPDPEMAFIRAVELLHPTKNYMGGIAPQAVVAESAVLAESVFVGPFAVIGEQVAIGENSAVLAGVYVGDNVVIGKNCRIYPYAVIYDNTIIGDNVTIHSGSIIGADGFGYKFREGAHHKVPQVGNVIVEDNVEIGANTCIDRGALGSTVIGMGSKIDNLVQVGHNNKIGKHVIMCGHTGVSGSCKIGDYAILAGSAGIADHVNIGQGAVILARSGVAGDVPAGAHYFGSPAKDKKTAYKEQFAISRLPELLKRVKQLEEEIAKLQGQ